MMQIDSTRHTIDYWICIHHSAHFYRFPSVPGCECAALTSFSDTTHLLWHYIIKYNEQTARVLGFCVKCSEFGSGSWL